MIATAWVHDFAPPIAGMVLAAPAFRVKLYVPFAVEGLRILHLALPKSKIKSYVKSKHAHARFTAGCRVRCRPAYFPADFGRHTAGSSRYQRPAAKRCRRNSRSHAAAGWPIRIGSFISRHRKRFFQQLGSPIKQMEVFPRSCHSLFHESNRNQIVDRTSEFLTQCFAQKPGSDDLIHSDKGGFTRTEYDLLKAPGSIRWKMVQPESENLRSAFQRCQPWAGTAVSIPGSHWIMSTKTNPRESHL